MNIEVSVVTPTYNRRTFISTAIEIYKNYDFPKENMEWIILDDGRDKVEDLFLELQKTVPNIRYHYEDEKMRIGAKRNWLNKEARGNIIIAMDDDDYYPADRIQTVVHAFKKHPQIQLAGSSEMYSYYKDTKQLYVMGPYGKNHATNGTMAWRKTYADTHQYSEYVTKAEETSFLENYKNEMIQLDSKKTILMICHTDNTVDKDALRNQTKGMRSVPITLEEFVKEPSLQRFYLTL
jgi:glycosyltransferase involved in cell wall biosynthesis